MFEYTVDIGDYSTERAQIKDKLKGRSAWHNRIYYMEKGSIYKGEIIFYKNAHYIISSLIEENFFDNALLDRVKQVLKWLEFFIDIPYERFLIITYTQNHQKELFRDYEGTYKYKVLYRELLQNLIIKLRDYGTPLLYDDLCSKQYSYSFYDKHLYYIRDIVQVPNKMNKSELYTLMYQLGKANRSETYSNPIELFENRSNRYYYREDKSYDISECFPNFNIEIRTK